MAASISARLSGAKSAARYFFKGIVRLFGEKEIFLWGQAIAFKVMVTFVPLVILATGILGRVLQRERPFETVKSVVREFLPAYQSEDVLDFLELFQQASGTITIIGVAGLLITVLTLFTTLRIVISNVFSEDWHDQRTILGGYLFDARMVVQVGLLFLLSVGLTVAVRTLNAQGVAFIEQMDLAETFLEVLWARGYRLLSFVIPYLLTVGVFFQLYYFVAKPRPPKRSALIGGVVAALLFEVAKGVFTLYATRVATFGRYDGTPQEDGIAVLIDTFGLLIALVFWAYYSGVVLVLGGFVALLHETRFRTHRAETGEDVVESERRGYAATLRRSLTRVRSRFGHRGAEGEPAAVRPAEPLAPEEVPAEAAGEERA
jgi:membrane protein